MSAAGVFSNAAPLVNAVRRSSRRNGGSSSSRRASYLTPRAAARTEFASFFPEEVTALEEPAAVEMAKKCKHIATPVPGRDKPVMTSCVGSPAPAGKDRMVTPRPIKMNTHRYVDEKDRYSPF